MAGGERGLHEEAHEALVRMLWAWPRPCAAPESQACCLGGAGGAGGQRGKKASTEATGKVVQKAERCPGCQES